LNSTLKSLLFWIVLIGVGIMIWSFSAGFQRGPAPISFTDFLQEVRDGQVHSVVMTGNQITGKRNGVAGNAADFRTYAPTQYERLANLLV
jgi:cell division protease FtsH